MKYKFWIEVDNGAGGSNLIEWVNLTQRTAKMMYNATAGNSRYLDSDLMGYGWEVQK